MEASDTKVVGAWLVGMVCAVQFVLCVCVCVCGGGGGGGGWGGGCGDIVMRGGVVLPLRLVCVGRLACSHVCCLGVGGIEGRC